jgi:hypothetical protein
MEQLHFLLGPARAKVRVFLRGPGAAKLSAKPGSAVHHNLPSNLQDGHWFIGPSALPKIFYFH